MKILLLSIFVCGVYCQNAVFTDLVALNEGYLIDVQQLFSKDLQCLKRVDSVLESMWKNELNKISTSDLGEVPDFWEYKEPSKTAYNTVDQEWLMDDGSPARQINKCFRTLAGSVAPLLNQNEIECLNNLFSGHIQYERELVKEFDNLLRTSSRDQLPFRRFISFTEFVELMFQNRNFEALTGVEPTVYSHAESYLSTEEDRVEKTYIMEQECEWKNARALREAGNDNIKYNEFVNQVRRSVNQQLASELVKKWDLNTTLPREKYQKWVKARQDMIPEIYNELQRLYEERRDAQYLCEYATKLAYKLSEKQAAILLPEDVYTLELSSRNVATKARSIEKELSKRKDNRHKAFKTLANEFEAGIRCLSSFSNLLTNHQRLWIASAFIDNHYSYPEIFCKEKNLNLGLIGTRFCKCIGSFCVAHSLAAFYADQYVLERGPDGSYRVVPSGLKIDHGLNPW